MKVSSTDMSVVSVWHIYSGHAQVCIWVLYGSTMWVTLYCNADKLHLVSCALFFESYYDWDYIRIPDTS